MPRARSPRVSTTGAGALTRLEVIEAPALPAGWSGKLWAISAGLRHAEQLAPSARYLLLTDADIEHAPDNLARLVCKAEREGQDLVSLMVRLACASFWERLLIPPFVFFFQLLYPFDAVNDPASRVAAAAGGCVLVRRQALHEAGGLASIRGALIDDVALARAIKRRPGGGRIWLGLGDSAQSLRRYERLGEIWAMVARTADTQLRHSLLLLLGTVLGMTLLYRGAAARAARLAAARQRHGRVAGRRGLGRPRARPIGRRRGSMASPGRGGRACRSRPACSPP